MNYVFPARFILFLEKTLLLFHTAIYYVFPAGFILCLEKTLLLFHTAFIKMFHLKLRFSMVQQFLSRLTRIWSCWFLFIRPGKKLPFNLFTNYPYKINCKKNFAYLKFICSICLIVDIYRLVRLLTLSLCYYF